MALTKAYTPAETTALFAFFLSDFLFTFPHSFLCTRLMIAGRQVFLFFLFFLFSGKIPIFSYFSKKIPIFSYFLSIYNFFYGNFEPHFAQHDILL